MADEMETDSVSTLAAWLSSPLCCDFRVFSDERDAAREQACYDCVQPTSMFEQHTIEQTTTCKTRAKLQLDLSTTLDRMLAGAHMHAAQIYRELRA